MIANFQMFEREVARCHTELDNSSSVERILTYLMNRMVRKCPEPVQLKPGLAPPTVYFGWCFHEGKVYKALVRYDYTEDGRCGGMPTVFAIVPSAGTEPQRWHLQVAEKQLLFASETDATDSLKVVKWGKVQDALKACDEEVEVVT